MRAMAKRGLSVTLIARKAGVSRHTARYWVLEGEAETRREKMNERNANVRQMQRRGPGHFNPHKAAIYGITLELSKLFASEKAYAKRLVTTETRLAQLRAQIAELQAERDELRNKL